MSAPRFTPEQRAAVEDRSGSRLLAANAGSGKTAVMVERFVEAVLGDEIPVAAILALTFTDKAAGELRDRIRQRFADLGAHEHAQAAEGAFVGTIHGFCMRVLRQHPFAAGLDPGFAVLEQAAAGRIARAAWDRGVEDWAAANGGAALDLLASYGPGLADTVLGVHSELRSRGQRRPSLPIPVEAPPPDPAALGAARDGVAALLAGAGGGVRVEAARRALEACEKALGAAGAGVPVPSSLDPAKLSNGAKVLGEPPCDDYREGWGAYRAACAAHHARSALILMDGLLGAYDDAYTAAKRTRAAVDFEDLQLAVRDLLAGDALLRARWAGRFELIMVDEFQDTNRLQLDVLEMLERDNLFAVGDEFQSIYGFRHADVTIFRDRRDALGEEGTRRLRANFRSRRELLDVLDTAFGPIFGADFEPLVKAPGTVEDDPVQEAGGELRLFDPDAVDRLPTASAGGGGGAVPVELLITDTRAWDDPPPELGLALPDVQPWRRAEARLVAARIREEIDRGRRPRDVVVLVRAAASLRLLEQALEEQELPTYVVGGRGYWSAEQVRDGLAYLSALANPLDETALHAVLASPFAGVGADALILAAQAGREAGGVWAALTDVAEGANLRGNGGRIPRWAHALPAEEAERLGGFVDFFAGERAVAERLPVEVLLERALAATGYDLAVLARAGGERRLANLRKLMRLARDYERAEGRDLRGFVAYAATQDLSQAREGEAALEGEGLDAVRLMTIHRAKGLEFPVVCVADLGRQGPGMRPRLLVGTDGRVGLRLATLGSGGVTPALDYDDLWAEREEAEGGEERRLLYVAMTRAEDLLVLSGGWDVARQPDPRPGGPPMDWVVRALLDDTSDLADGVRTREFDGRPARLALRFNSPERLRAILPARRGAPPATAPGIALPPAPDLPPAAHGPGQAPLPAATARLSYSSLGEYARCGYRFYLQRVLRMSDVTPPVEALPAGATGGLDARLRGTLVHEVLEHADLRAPRAPDAQEWRALAATHGATLTDDEVEDLQSLVETFASAPIRGRLAAARSVRREAPFAVALEPGSGAPLLHGVVDVIAHEADGTVLVVDHKTDRLDGADPSELADRAYGAQRAAYALAALREGAERVEVVHLFLERPDEPAVAEFTRADQGALAERLLRLAEGALAGRFPVAEHPHRELCGSCPGRRALCSHPESRTLRPAQDLVAGVFSGSGGPS